MPDIPGCDDAPGTALLCKSFGPAWDTEWAGSGDPVRMAYDAFRAPTQGGAFFIDEI